MGDPIEVRDIEKLLEMLDLPEVREKVIKIVEVRSAIPIVLDEGAKKLLLDLIARQELKNEESENQDKKEA